MCIIERRKKTSSKTIIDHASILITYAYKKKDRKIAILSFYSDMANKDDEKKRVCH